MKGVTHLHKFIWAWISGFSLGGALLGLCIQAPKLRNLFAGLFVVVTFMLVSIPTDKDDK